MLRRITAVPVLAALALLAPAAHAGAPTPQITDVSGDANFGDPTGNVTPARNHPTPGSQDYADVVSVLWQSTFTTKVVRRHRVSVPSGFTVTMTLTAAPKPPTGTSVVYRTMGDFGNCGFFGVAYYSSKDGIPNTPQSAVRDGCPTNGGDARLTAIAPPAINGNTIKWTVPLSAIPKDTKIGAGSTLKDLWFQIAEIESFQGQCVPDPGLPPKTGYEGTCGLGAGTIDDSARGPGTFTIGK